MGYLREDSIIQQWAADLGLRHQGVLVSAIRGCDSVSRDDPSKYLVRVYRGILLRPHCFDISKAASFMLPFSGPNWEEEKINFLKSIDHYPNHWILHFAHACEIVGYKHPEAKIRVPFYELYYLLVKKFHMRPEDEAALDRRLNADEETFAKSQLDEA